jgi:AcrR family transcriptional regulator
MGDDLPDEVALLWGVRNQGRRGPKPTLTPESIISAAVEVADAEGLAAVTMPRVAAHLGSATMALYRHVANKDQLLQLMADAALARPPDLPAEDDWRSSIARWARSLRGQLMAHPWFAALPVTAPPAGPGSLAWLDRALEALGPLGIEEGHKVEVVLTLLNYVHGEVRLTCGLIEGYRRNPDSFGAGYGAVLARVVDAQAFPALSRTVAAGVFDEPAGPPQDDDFDFEFGLARLLDGIAAFADDAAEPGPSGQTSRRTT